MTSAASIERLREGDLPAVLELSRLERWNQTEEDWRRLLELSPEGCFRAVCAGMVVGVVTSVSYGDLAWIGMMIVASSWRGKGIGKALMLEAFDWCQARHVTLIGLDATPAGQPLYETLGFKPFDKLDRWEGRGRGSVTVARTPTDGKLHKDIYTFDAGAFYQSRRDVLRKLLEVAAVEPAVSYDGAERVNGYALARAGVRASYIGPVVAADRRVAVRLLDTLLDRLHGSVYVDPFAGVDGVADALASRGFRTQRSLTRMFRTQERPAATPKIFASAGPELG